MEEKGTVQLNLNIPPGLRPKVKAILSEQGRSMTSWIVEQMEKLIEENGDGRD